MVPVGPGWPKEDDVTYLQVKGWVYKSQGEGQGYDVTYVQVQGMGVQE